MWNNSGINSSIHAQIKAASASDDVRQLRALASNFPEQFESFRGQKSPENNLVDIAWSNKADAALISLIVEHGFEVSKKFEKQHKHAEWKDANEYHQTMELLAAAALKRPAGQERADACHVLKDWAREGCRDTENLNLEVLHPEFVHQLASGRLAEFMETRCNDRRVENLSSMHSMVLADAFYKHRDEIQSGIKAKAPLVKAMYASQQPATAKSATGIA